MITQKEILKIRKSLNGEVQRAIFKILSDTNRYQICQMLCSYPKLSVSDISKILEISLPLSSQHLKILVLGNILEKEREGKNVYYKLRPENTLAKEIFKKII